MQHSPYESTPDLKKVSPAEEIRKIPFRQVMDEHRPREVL
jgi:hypothetical protein